MKSRLFATIIVVVVLVLALPAVASASQKSASLEDVYWLDGKGWVAIFSVEGDWTNADLHGNQAIVGDVYYDMDCATRDDDKVVCVIGGLGAQAGRAVAFQFGGIVYRWQVPAGTADVLECANGMEMLFLKYVMDDGSHIKGSIIAPADLSTVGQKRHQLHLFVESIAQEPVEHERLVWVHCLHP